MTDDRYGDKKRWFLCFWFVKMAVYSRYSVDIGDYGMRHYQDAGF